MKSLGNNHGTSSHLKDLMIMYKMASLVNDSEKMERFLKSIEISAYSDSSKASAFCKLRKWELDRKADKIIKETT